MTWTIYLLSILNNTGVIEATAVLVALVSAVTMAIWTTLASQPDDYHDQMERYNYCKKCIRTNKIIFIVAISIILIGVFIPSRESLTKSYLMVEGSKIANAKTSKEAADAILKRVDRFIEAIEKADK